MARRAERGIARLLVARAPAVVATMWAAVATMWATAGRW